MSCRSAFTRTIRSGNELVHLDPAEKQLLASVTVGVQILYNKIKNEDYPHRKGTHGQSDHSGRGQGQTDSSGRYRCVVGEVMINRYHILHCLTSQGQSAVLVKAKDVFMKRAVIIKILHNKYYNIGIQEAHLLSRLHSADPLHVASTVRLISTFKHNGHYCMVFESLYPQPITELFTSKPWNVQTKLSEIRKLTVKLLQVLSFFKQQNIIHADLKPENILLQNKNDVRTVKVIDFGNAVHHVHREVSMYYDKFELQTLLYRAPEVIYGIPFGCEVDMWSLGCVLAELFLGQPLFMGHTKRDLLKEISGILGPLPVDIFQRGKFYKEFSQFAGKSSIQDATQMLLNRLTGCYDYMFANFLAGLLKLNPDDRLTPVTALQHPFLAAEFSMGVLLKSDGTKESIFPLKPENYTERPQISSDIKRQNPSTFDLLRIGTATRVSDDTGHNVAVVCPLSKLKTKQVKTSIVPPIGHNSNQTIHSSSVQSHNRTNIESYIQPVELEVPRHHDVVENLSEDEYAGEHWNEDIHIDNTKSIISNAQNNFNCDKSNVKAPLSAQMMSQKQSENCGRIRSAKVSSPHSSSKKVNTNWQNVNQILKNKFLSGLQQSQSPCKMHHNGVQQLLRSADYSNEQHSDTEFREVTDDLCLSNYRNSSHENRLASSRGIKRNPKIISRFQSQESEEFSSYSRANLQPANLEFDIQNIYASEDEMESDAESLKHPIPNCEEFYVDSPKSVAEETVSDENGSPGRYCSGESSPHREYTDQSIVHLNLTSPDIKNHSSLRTISSSKGHVNGPRASAEYDALALPIGHEEEPFIYFNSKNQRHSSSDRKGINYPRSGAKSPDIFPNTSMQEVQTQYKNITKTSRIYSREPKIVKDQHSHQHVGAESKPSLNIEGLKNPAHRTSLIQNQHFIPKEMQNPKSLKLKASHVIKKLRHSTESFEDQADIISCSRESSKVKQSSKQYRQIKKTNIDSPILPHAKTQVRIKTKNAHPIPTQLAVQTTGPKAYYCEGEIGEDGDDSTEEDEDKYGTEFENMFSQLVQKKKQNQEDLQRKHLKNKVYYQYLHPKRLTSNASPRKHCDSVLKNIPKTKLSLEQSPQHHNKTLITDDDQLCISEIKAEPEDESHKYCQNRNKHKYISKHQQRLAGSLNYQSAAKINMSSNVSHQRKNIKLKIPKSEPTLELKQEPLTDDCSDSQILCFSPKKLKRIENGMKYYEGFDQLSNKDKYIEDKIVKIIPSSFKHKTPVKRRTQTQTEDFLSVGTSSKNRKSPAINQNQTTSLPEKTLFTSKKSLDKCDHSLCSPCQVTNTLS